MIIGIPRERKNREYRVGATPALVRSLSRRGHEVWVEKDAGKGVDISDEMFEEAGAKIIDTPEKLWGAEMIIKVKEPQKEEFPLMKKGQILFCFLHLAPTKKETELLKEKEVVAIAFETMNSPDGRLPILIPMSEIAGRLSVQIGAMYLQKNYGGKGLLLGGIPGVRRGKVVVVGGGIAGSEAARMAIGLGAEVIILDRSIKRLQELENRFNGLVSTLYASETAVENALKTADLVVGSVHSRGQATAKVITKKMIASMEKGSVFIDIAIDQGGCAETSRPTSHDQPIYEVDGVIHYCVPNMPSTVARTATEALANVTADFAIQLADKGWKKALQDDNILFNGLNVCLGSVTNKEVAQAQGDKFVDPALMVFCKESLKT